MLKSSRREGIVRLFGDVRSSVCTILAMLGLALLHTFVTIRLAGIGGGAVGVIATVLLAAYLDGHLGVTWGLVAAAAIARSSLWKVRLALRRSTVARSHWGQVSLVELFSWMKEAAMVLMESGLPLERMPMACCVASLSSFRSCFRMW